MNGIGREVVTPVRIWAVANAFVVTSATNSSQASMSRRQTGETFRFV